MQIILDENGKGSLPAKTGRQGVVAELKSGTACWAFEADVTASGATQGQSMAVDVGVSMAATGTGRAFACPVYFAGSVGARILYTEVPG